MEKVNKKRKLGFKETKIGFIPIDWDCINLGDHCIIRGRIGWKGLKQSEYKTTGPCLIASKHISRGKVNWERCDHISEERYLESIEIALERGDVIFSKDGALGNPALIDKLTDKATINSTMMLLRPNGTIDSNFLYQILKSRLFDKLILEKVSGGAIPHIFQRDMKDFIIPSPPKSEQKEISKIFNLWDKAIEKTEQLIVQKQQLKKGLMQQLLTGKVRFNEFVKSTKMKKTKLGLVPEDWEVEQLGNVGTIYTGGTPDTTSSKYWNGHINWYTPTEVTKAKKYIGESERKISIEGLKNSSAKLFPAGTIVICTRATIGEISISLVEACTNQGFKSLFPNSKTDVNFLYYQLLFLKKEFIRKSAGSTFLELSTSDFRLFEIPYPSIKEQGKIAALVSSFDTEISSLQNQLDKTKEQKKGLMQKLLTGEVRVKI